MLIVCFALVGFAGAWYAERLTARRCGQALGRVHRYSLMIASLCSFALIPLRLPASEWGWALLIGPVLVYICISDLRERRIPNAAIGSLCIGSLGRAVLMGRIPETLSGGVVGLTVFLATALVCKHMGSGDIKLATAVGLWLGWPTVLSALLWGILLAGVIVFGLLLLKIRRPHDVIPYGPYLAISLWLCWTELLALCSCR